MMTSSPPALPLVFLHGWLSGGDDWSEVAAGFEGPFVSCPNLCPDTDWNRAVERMASSLDACVLVGYSMGGRVALGLSLAPHSPVRGLVLVSANPGIENESDRRQRRESDAVLQERLVNTDRRVFLDTWFRQSLFCSIDDASRQRWIDERARIDLAHQRELLACYGIANQPNYWPRLRTLEIPVLLITGSLDTKYAEIQQRAAMELPDCELEILPGTSHAPHRERPTLVKSRIESWYRRRIRAGISDIPRAVDEPSPRNHDPAARP